MAKPHELFDPDPTKMAVAALVACIVQTLRESDPSFQERFLDRLGGGTERYDMTSGPVIGIAWRR